MESDVCGAIAQDFATMANNIVLSLSMAKDAFLYTYSAEWKGTVDSSGAGAEFLDHLARSSLCPLSGPHDRDHVTKVQYPCPRQVDTLRYEKVGYSADATSRAHMFRAGMASHWATRARATCGGKTCV